MRRNQAFGAAAGGARSPVTLALVKCLIYLSAIADEFLIYLKDKLGFFAE